MARIGRPKALPESVRVETTVPRELAEAIDALVLTSGMSRYAFLRQVLIIGLQPLALTNSDLAAALPATTYDRKRP